MTELEMLRKNIQYLRAFARNVRTIALDASPYKHKERLRAIVQEVRTCENQWPNWLDDGVEALKDEDDDQEAGPAGPEAVPG